MTGWRLAPGAKWLDDCTLAGGAPYRVMKLSGRGAGVVRTVIADAPPGPELRPDEAELVSRLRRSGLLLPPPPTAARTADVTVVIPALSEAEPVLRLLCAVPPDAPVVLVDDGSPVPLADAMPEQVRVLRHDRPGGPAAARNAGAAVVRTAWIAFVDADVEPPVGWLGALLGYAEDDVVALAPRVRSERSGGLAGWFEAGAGGLDQGAAPADVAVGHPVSYLPSAALLVRTSAFIAAGGFTEDLRVGEDVDLVWRLARLGRIRYEPDVVVAHAARTTLRAALDRRRLYGTSAAALAARHPGTLRHVDVSVWSFVPWLLGLVNPAAGLLGAAAGVLVAPLGLRRLSARHARRLAVDGHVRAAASLGRWLVRPMLPLTAAVLLLVPRARPRLGAAVAVGLADLTVRAARTRGGTAPGPAGVAGAVFAATIDDVAYSVGVWQGVWRHRNVEPLAPRVRMRTGR